MPIIHGLIFNPCFFCKVNKKLINSVNLILNHVIINKVNKEG